MKIRSLLAAALLGLFATNPTYAATFPHPHYSQITVDNTPSAASDAVRKDYVDTKATAATTAAIAGAPVQTVAGRAGAVVLTHSDLSDFAASAISSTWAGSGFGFSSAPTPAQVATPLAATGMLVNIPPSYQVSAPDLIADYAHQIFSSRVEGLSTLSSFGGTTFAAGATGSATYMDPASGGHFAISGAPRFTSDSITRKPIGILVEPAAQNYITDPVLLASGWNGGADSQGKLNTDLPPLFPGVVIVKAIRDTNPTANVGTFSFTMPSNVANTAPLAFSWTWGIWVYVPVGSTATAITFNSGGTGVSVSKFSVDLNKKGQWQYVSGLVNNSSSAFGQTVSVFTNMLSDVGGIVYTTAPSFVPITSPTSFTASSRTADSLVSAGSGLDNLAATSGTLIYRGWARGGTSTAITSGGIVASDVAGANSVTLQVIGDAVNPFLQAVVKAGGTTIATETGSAIKIGQPYTAAVSWSPTVINYADSLGTSVTTSVASAPAGMSGFSAIAGPNPIQRVGYIASALSLSALQSYVVGGTVVNLTANPAAPGLTIPTCFNGLSWETNDSLQNHQFQAASSSLIALYNRLGCVQTRIGGSSSDLAFTPTNTEATDLAAFLSAVNGGSQPLLFGLNLGQGVSSGQQTSAATVASQVAAAIPSVVFQIGNEPDLYTTNTLRTIPYNVTDYETEWATMRSAVVASVPAAKFAGPDIGQVDQWFLNFLGSSDAANCVIATRHFYPIPAGATATIPNLFASDYQPLEFIAGDVAAATAHSLGVRLSETNSIFNGGQTGVSNVQASAIWALEYMGQVATAGVAGVDFHGARLGIYSAMTLSGTAWTPQSLYYALLAWSGLEGGQIIPVTSDTSSNVVYSFGVLGSDGKTRILIVNKSLTQTATVNVSQPGSWTTASSLVLTATNASATNTTLGGSTVSSTGAYSPSPVVTTKSGSSAAVSVPPASATVVTLS